MQPPTEVATATGNPDSRIRLHGVSLVVRGEGAPVFLLHGIGGNASSCGALAQLLSDAGYRTFCWDAPGYGESADPRSPVDHPGLVLQILTSLALGPTHLIGTSWGGVIATKAAAQAPDAVRSLVLADSTRGSAVTGDSAASMLARIPELAETGPEAFAGRRASRLLSPATDTVTAAAVRSEMAAVRLPGYTAAATMMAATDTTELLPSLRVPSLVLVGEDDVVTGVAESRILAESLPDACFKIIPGAGHAAVQEKPAEMASSILKFWKRLS
ncbi:pimeloyl-ACP methyl ester carboxylesterase [Arthrobacter sp. GAS37]|uniref:alpha/beta fold hydrolase n=1 Tax=Arthrobacter sp. GAS37 TaxID=3156261 RepID=UPI003832D20F